LQWRLSMMVHAVRDKMVNPLTHVHGNNAQSNKQNGQRQRRAWFLSTKRRSSAKQRAGWRRKWRTETKNSTHSTLIELKRQNLTVHFLPQKMWMQKAEADTRQVDSSGRCDCSPSACWPSLHRTHHATHPNSRAHHKPAARNKTE